MFVISIFCGVVQPQPTVWKFENFSPLIFSKNSVKLTFSLELYCKSIWRKIFAVWENFRNYYTLQPNLGSRGMTKDVIFTLRIYSNDLLIIVEISSKHRFININVLSLERYFVNTYISLHSVEKCEKYSHLKKFRENIM